MTKDGSHDGDSKRRSLKSYLTPTILTAAFLCFAAAIFVSGFFYVKETLKTTWQARAIDFKWLVLVQGEPIDIDEAGRYLTQLEGVTDVRFVSQQDVFNMIKDDPLFSSDLRDLGTQSLPASWEVKWAPSALDRAILPDLISETKRLPGILDIAYDKNTLDNIRSLRLHWHEARLILSLLGAIGLLAAIFMIGRILFFKEQAVISFKKMGPAALTLILSWAAGAGMVAWFLGAIPLALYGGGVVVWLFFVLFRNQPHS